MPALKVMDNSVKITSVLSIDEAVDSLAREVKSTALSTCTTEALAGRVSHEKVYLYRIVPFVGNSFLPVFEGAFEENGGVTVLSGRWAFHLYAKVFGVLYAALLIFTFFSGTIPDTQVTISLIIVNLLFLFVGWFSWRISSQLASDDKAWIVRYVTHAINPPNKSIRPGRKNRNVC
jgi:hypothetical protein